AEMGAEMLKSRNHHIPVTTASTTPMPMGMRKVHHGGGRAGRGSSIVVGAMWMSSPRCGGGDLTGGALPGFGATPGARTVAPRRMDSWPPAALIARGVGVR